MVAQLTWAERRNAGVLAGRMGAVPAPVLARGGGTPAFHWSYLLQAPIHFPANFVVISCSPIIIFMAPV
jgi:hypothetical protein